MASQAEEERTSLMLLGTTQENKIKEQAKEIAALKKGTSPLGSVAETGVEIATAAMIGGFEGYKSAGDPTKMAGISNVAPVVAIVGGGIAAVASGPGMTRTAGMNIAKAGAVILAYNLTKDEAAKMAVQSLKTAALAAAKAQALPGTPGVNGVAPQSFRGR